VTVKIEGFKELDRALGLLPKATAKNVLKRTLVKAAEPVDDVASGNAPKDTGALELSVVTGTKLTRSQRGAGPSLTAGGYRSAAKNYVEVHIGTRLARGIFMEFGTFKDPPDPWFRTAWDATKDSALRVIKEELGGEIEKAAKRYAKKLGRA
jgi:HK97 gp10 family phage protein